MKQSWVSLYVRYAARRILHLPVRIVPSRLPHAFVFATRRGGSTLIRDAIWSQKGFDYIDEPYDFHKVNPYRGMFGSPQADHVFLGEHNCASVFRYTDNLLTGRFYVRSEWNWLDSRFSSTVERFVVKIHCIKSHADRLVDHYGDKCVPVAFFRHPIPTSLSILSQGWRNNSHEFLENPWFCESVLTSVQVDKARDSLARGSPLVGMVVNWLLENQRLLQLCSGRGWLLLSYESLLMDPLAVFTRLKSPLQLDPDESQKFERSVRTKTRSVFSRESARAISQMSREELLGRWLTKVSQEDQKQIQELLDTFENSLYRADHCLPQGLS